MIMGGEQGPALRLVVHRLDHRPGDGEPVIGRGAAADLVEDDETARCRLGEDRRRLDHLDHEGRAAAGETVGRADPAEQAIDHADLGAGGGDEASGLDEDGDQRRLPQEGRLAAHVGTGDQPQPVVAAERQIVGDEAFAGFRQSALDDRVTAGVDFETRFVGQFRQAPAPFGGARRIAGGDVDPRQCGGGRGDGGGSAKHQRGQFLGMGSFGGQRMGACLDHARRFLVQLGRIEADDPRQCLAMGEAAVRRHQPVGVAGRDFDMIAEDRIVADLERTDAGRVAIARFQSGDGAAAVR